MQLCAYSRRGEGSSDGNSYTRASPSAGRSRASEGKEERDEERSYKRYYYEELEWPADSESSEHHQGTKTTSREEAEEKVERKRPIGEGLESDPYQGVWWEEGHEEEKEKEKEEDEEWSDSELHREFQRLFTDGGRGGGFGLRPGSTDEEEKPRQARVSVGLAHRTCERADGPELAGRCAERRSGPYRRSEDCVVLRHSHQRAVSSMPTRTSRNVFPGSHDGPSSKGRCRPRGGQPGSEIYGAAPVNAGPEVVHGETHGVTLDDANAATSALVLASRKHSRLVEKVQGRDGGWYRKGKGKGRGDWRSYGDGAENPKGGKGKDGKKGKGKGRGGGGQGWDAKVNEWEKKKETPAEK